MNYQPSGPKEDEYTKYQVLNFIEKNIEGFVPEDVDTISVLLGKLLRWLQLAIHVRKEDIVKRKSLNQRRKEEREAKITAKQEYD